ncbi:hypothetical protein ITJ38_07915 [Agreia pratensis]|uniref:UsfY protein n=1 Tax=Agreia pratensis TaxID=150121 RepID=A0A1X7K5T7_9MICO|nr:hypothetical protein [Agreia pratensis]MBF4634323.1 hypothetical protein [Agreia pratensis]SMG36372.1 hypothetical protein SAMN06296010_2147 [Agreia pratensis]
MSANLPSEDRVPAEPFAWMSKTNPTGPYRFTLRSPASEAAMGIFLIVAGVGLVALLLADPSAPAIAMAVVLFVLAVGAGVLLLVMSVARARWIRAYKRVHGHVPPY